MTLLPHPHQNETCARMPTVFPESGPWALPTLLSVFHALAAPGRIEKVVAVIARGQLEGANAALLHRTQYPRGTPDPRAAAEAGALAGDQPACVDRCRPLVDRVDRA
ncbi:hypothetical protein G6F31_020743 [Rhizopus arrhizus]|nr:hypothetical protein G6F31_020743 [Rhizopus arrhizus]